MTTAGIWQAPRSEPTPTSIRTSRPAAATTASAPGWFGLRPAQWASTPAMGRTRSSPAACAPRASPRHPEPGSAGEGKPDQRDRTDDDAVPGEDAKAVPADEIDEAPNHEQRRLERDDEADRDQQPVVDGQDRAVLVEVVDGGAEHRRDRQKERELGCRRAVNAQHQRAHDGRAGARHPG